MPELPERRVEPDVAAIACHLAAAGEHPAVQITVDGTPEPQP
jgi:hypothetical protein